MLPIKSESRQGHINILNFLLFPFHEMFGINQDLTKLLLGRYKFDEAMFVVLFSSFDAPKLTSKNSAMSSYFQKKRKELDVRY